MVFGFWSPLRFVGFKETFMKRITIIGATSGIGRALACLYAEAGHQVAVTGRRQDLLHELKEAYPNNILVSCFDVTGSEDIGHIQKLIQDMQGLDLLIYNAGFGDPSKELVE